MVTVAPGLRAQSPLRMTYRLDDPTGLVALDTGEQLEYPYAFVGETVVIKGRYEITRMLFDGARAPIGTGWLAKAPIAELRLYALNYTNIEVDDDVALGREIYANTYVSDWCGSVRGGSPSSDLRGLAMVYRVIRLGWRNPVARLSSLLDVHHDTVRRWIVSAVKNGYLESWERG